MAPLWTPSVDRIARANLTRFITFAGDRCRLDAPNYPALYDWSVHKPLEFWDAMWDFGGVRGSRGSRIAIDLDHMPGAAFFPDATLNFAENVLHGNGAPDDGVAILHRTETTPLQSMSWREL